MPRVWETNPNMLIPYYLMFSYLYYEKNISLIDDSEFDKLCKTLHDKFDEVQHINKDLVSKSDLTAGTGYGINYTNRIKSAAMSLTKDILWTTN